MDLGKLPHPLELHTAVKEYFRLKGAIIAECAKEKYDIEVVAEMQDAFRQSEATLKSMVELIEADKHGFIEIAQENNYIPVTGEEW